VHLIYFADPMCSWCYGFGPQIARVLEAHPDARFDLVMGGLRAFNRGPATETFRRSVLEHWEHVKQASGLELDDAALAREGFVYDTEPPCRAVVTARLIEPKRALAFLGAVQAAFYRGGRDVTQADILADIAAEHGYDRARFTETFGGWTARHETDLDFSTTHTLKISGFPTLGFAHGDQLHLVTVGFCRAEVLEERLARLGRELACA
jgi:putative protein-disulfide isomerase